MKSYFCEEKTWKGEVRNYFYKKEKTWKRKVRNDFYEEIKTWKGKVKGDFYFKKSKHEKGKWKVETI